MYIYIYKRDAENNNDTNYIYTISIVVRVGRKYYSCSNNSNIPGLCYLAYNIASSYGGTPTDMLRKYYYFQNKNSNHRVTIYIFDLLKYYRL